MTESTADRDDAHVDVEIDTSEVVRRPGRILVTNDDGIEAPGLRLLATGLADRFDDVLVAAPSSDLSGTGTGIGRYDPDAGVGMRRADVDGIEGYAIDGPPGLAVMAAALGAFGAAPDLVVSGVNNGMNTGHSVLHSGTVGGALTAATFGGRGLAVSLDVDQLGPDGERRWDTAVQVAVAVVGWMRSDAAPAVINLNVPSVPVERLRGARWARLDDFGYFSVASADVAGAALTLEVTDRTSGLDPTTDTALCRAGYVTLTALRSVEPAAVPDSDAGTVTGIERRSDAG
ncbi:5'/3'-nucleotidase SurE [Egicoccus halophilus]|uniref:5'-nucleotidase n=1 Tax=Egicoccus halophilus TaxID=1670830 RepID=A0A8J3EUX2_9ACTN|nr:5'/3'-nucleotidase SurE [Egicoccus halophilus]GGI08538.1 5'/3'-nucleotidase SurE [Egicoccus halophilus]